MAKPRYGSAAFRAKVKGYRSGIEMLLTEMLQRNGIPFKYEDKEQRIKFVEPESWHTYLCDFFFVKNEGGLMLVDTKGRWEYPDRLKHYRIWQQCPGLDIRLLFEQNPAKTKITKKVTVADICTEGLGYKSRGIDWKPFSRPFEWCPIRQRDKKKVVLDDAFPAAWLDEIDMVATRQYMEGNLNVPVIP